MCTPAQKCSYFRHICFNLDAQTKNIYIYIYIHVHFFYLCHAFPPILWDFLSVLTFCLRRKIIFYNICRQLTDPIMYSSVSTTEEDRLEESRCRGQLAGGGRAVRSHVPLNWWNIIYFPNIEQFPIFHCSLRSTIAEAKLWVLGRVSTGAGWRILVGD